MDKILHQKIHSRNIFYHFLVLIKNHVQPGLPDDIDQISLLHKQKSHFNFQKTNKKLK